MESQSVYPPRHFGKTLNMSMHRCFFEIGTDKELFEGLDIARNEELCERYMGKYPVIFLSLKGVDGLAFKEARYRLTEEVGVEAGRFRFLAASDRLTESEKSKHCAMVSVSDGL